MTKEEAIANAKIRADRSGMVWYVVNMPYGYDCVTEHFKCVGNMIKTNRTEPNLNYKVTKEDKILLNKILKNIKK